MTTWNDVAELENVRQDRERAYARIRELEEQLVAAQHTSHAGPIGLGVSVLSDDYGSAIAYRSFDTPDPVLEFVKTAHKRHAQRTRLARLRIALEAVVGLTLVTLAVMALYTPQDHKVGVVYALAPMVLVSFAALCVVAINRRISQL